MYECMNDATSFGIDWLIIHREGTFIFGTIASMDTIRLEIKTCLLVVVGSYIDHILDRLLPFYNWSIKQLPWHTGLLH
jgi:hypothetical protein